MSTKPTLADFARLIGISPVTARQWKRRGRIVGRDSGFELSRAGRDSLRDSVTDPERDDVTGVTSETVTERDSVTHCHALRIAACERDNVELRGRVALLEALTEGYEVFVRRLSDLEAATRRSGRTEAPDPEYLESQRHGEQ